MSQQQRVLELSRFGLRQYDLAQHMISHQGAVTKLLGNTISKFNPIRNKCCYVKSANDKLKGF